MDKRTAKLLSKNELVRLVTSLREETRSLRVVIAIQREFIKLYTGKDVDHDLDKTTT